MKWFVVTHAESRFGVDFNMDIHMKYVEIATGGISSISISLRIPLNCEYCILVSVDKQLYTFWEFLWIEVLYFLYL